MDPRSIALVVSLKTDKLAGMKTFEKYYLNSIAKTYVGGGFYQFLKPKFKKVRGWGHDSVTHEMLEKTALTGQPQAFQRESHPDHFNNIRLFPVQYNKIVTGILAVKSESQNHFDRIHLNHLDEVSRQVSPLLHGSFENNTNLLDWLDKIKSIAPDKIDWIGLYFRVSWILFEDTTDLILGPFIGESTKHTRIPLNKGFCGLALSEERTVNVPDVTKKNRHLACNPKTRSEIVIPLLDSEGEFIAELDIDSNTLNTFDEGLSSQLHLEAAEFSNLT